MLPHNAANMWILRFAALLFCISAQAEGTVTVSFNEGEHVLLKCPGTPSHLGRLQIWWSFGSNDTLVATRDHQSGQGPIPSESDGRFQLHLNGSLTITDARASDAGDYYCRVADHDRQPVHLISESGLYTISLEEDERGEQGNDAGSGKVALIAGVAGGLAVLLLLTLVLLIVCVQCRGKKTDENREHSVMNYDVVRSCEETIQPDQLGLEDNLLYDAGNRPRNALGLEDNLLYDAGDRPRNMEDAVVYSQPIKKRPDLLYNDTRYESVHIGQDGPVLGARTDEVNLYEDLSAPRYQAPVKPTGPAIHQYDNVVLPTRGGGLVYADLDLPPAKSGIPQRKDGVMYSDVKPIQQQPPSNNNNQPTRSGGLVYADLDLPPSKSGIPQRKDGVMYSDVKPIQQ